MRIGCLAWGSLVWDPRTLPMVAPFHHAGPSLPIEFSRISQDGRVTLVIDPAAAWVETYWVLLDTEQLEDAVAALALREGIPAEAQSQHVGWHCRDGARFTRGDEGEDMPVVDWANADRSISEWLEGSSLDAILWTALPMRRPDKTLGRPDVESLLDHIRTLAPDARARAERYVRRTPRPIDTSNRRRFEDDLGWTPLDRDGPPSRSVSTAAGREGAQPDG